MEKLWSDRVAEQFCRWRERIAGGVRGGFRSDPENPSKDGPGASSRAVMGRKAPQPFRTSPIPEQWKQQVLTDVPVYPPFRQGLPLLPVELLLQSQSALIREIYGAAGVRLELWKSFYLPVIHAYAHYVHLLPASEGNHHRGAGGLLRHGLEASLYAVRLTDGKDSLEKSAHLLHPTERRRQEDALRLATFCAALLHDVGKPFTDMQVFGQGDGPIWNPALHPSLFQWGQEHQVEFYNLRWKSNRLNRHKSLGIATAPHLLHKNVLAFLSDADPFWVESVLKSISGDEIGVNKVRDFATFGDRESVRFDLKNQGGDGSDIGIPVERYLLDAMRTLIRGGAWAVNQSSVAWVVTLPDEGISREIAPGTAVLALHWPKAGADVIAALHQSGTPGIPKDPQLVADMLLDRGIALPSREESGDQQRIPFWFLLPDSSSGLGNADPVGQRVLVLQNPGYLLDIQPPPSSRVLYSTKASRNEPKESSTEKNTPSTKTPIGMAQPPVPAEGHGKKQSSIALHPPGGRRAETAPQIATKRTSPGEKELPREETSPSAVTAEPGDARQENLSVGLRVLRTIVREILIQRRDSSVFISAGPDAAYLKFPDAFKDLGIKPIELLGMLNEEHLIIAAPESPEKLTQKLALPGQKTESTVAVLSPLAIQKIPCLGLNLMPLPEDLQSAYQRHLIDHAAECAGGKFVKDRNSGTGYWFLPVEWAIERLRAQFRDDHCPERFLRSCTIGPASDGGDGLYMRLTV